ncbi:hypothetical protein [Kribbella swartbergensis]
MTSTSDRHLTESADGGREEVARREAEHLKDVGTAAAGDVAGTAKEKASEITSDVREQTRRLAGETREQLTGQMSEQRDRAVGGLRGMSEELRGMAEHGQSGWGAQLARQGATWTDQVAEFLQDRELGDVLEDLRQMARRRPGRFLLGAVAAGVVAGRMSRALAGGSSGADRGTGDSVGSNGSVGDVGVPPSAVGDFGTPAGAVATGEPGTPTGTATGGIGTPTGAAATGDFGTSTTTGSQPMSPGPTPTDPLGTPPRPMGQ